MTATLTRHATRCRDCDEPTLNVPTQDGERLLVLDAEPVVQGLWAIDADGYARRRGLSELFREGTSLRNERGGRDEHVCEQPDPMAWLKE